MYKHVFVLIFCFSNLLRFVQNASIAEIDWSDASLFGLESKISQRTFTKATPAPAETLVLVHTVFRHGDRTTDKDSSWPTNLHANDTYYPYGWGQLTNKGKLKEFNLGKKLHDRYINFLGKTWTPEVLDARSTAYNRTKMSLQLVLAGLYPPVDSQIFQTGLSWQPIPYNYIEAQDDDLLLTYSYCSAYIAKREELSLTPEHTNELESYQFIFDYLTEHSGMEIKNYRDATNLYFGITTTVELGAALPDWAKSVYPATLEDLAIKNYQFSASTIEFKRFLSGKLIKKIVDDTKAKIQGTLNPPERKLFLYSGHEINVAYLLLALGVYEPHVPPYGACIMVEVHNINGMLGVKLYYEDYTQTTPKLLTIPGCAEFCPLTNFFNLLADKFPTEAC